MPIQNNSKMKREIIFLLLCVGFASVGLAKKLPEVRLRDVNGGTVVTSELNNGGKPMLISFFAMWCKPCIQEMKTIGDEYEQWQKLTGVRMIAVSIDDARSTEKVSSFVRANGFKWTTLLDNNSEFKRAMGVNQIPHLFLLDGGGNVVWQHTSYSEGVEEEILEQLLKLNH